MRRVHIALVRPRDQTGRWSKASWGIRQVSRRISASVPIVCLSAAARAAAMRLAAPAWQQRPGAQAEESRRYGSAEDEG